MSRVYQANVRHHFILFLVSVLTTPFTNAFSYNLNTKQHRSSNELNDIREKVKYADETFELPNKLDLSTIEDNQIHHPIQTFAIGRRCIHGYPQAYGNHPVAHKINSGLFRLTCPLLVQAIDTWENEGGVREMSDLVRSGARISSSKNITRVEKRNDNELTWMDQFRKVNNDNAKIRKSVIESYPGGWEKVQSKLGEENSERFLESGIAGLGRNSGVADVKCLHAHVADHLCRGTSPEESNLNILTLGNEILRRLTEQRGVSIDGSGEACWKQCSGGCSRRLVTDSDKNSEENSDWKEYTPKKNRQKLRSTRQRRQEIRSVE